jgi:uncharacterized protein YecE (DUF72 family)
MTELRIGTSAFTADGWLGSFYPKGTQQRDYLSYYATQFDRLELDNTWYRTPAASVVEGWNLKTPFGFIFTAKVPQVITQEKVLLNCDDDLNHFLKTMSLLGDKLGPLLFQFGSFNQKDFKTQDDFIARLKPFLAKLPKEFKYAVEIRNKHWMNQRHADVLHEYGIAMALIDQSWVPRPWEMKQQFDMITADFTYVRWLGDRRGIEELTESWDKTVIDRTSDLQNWVELLRKVHERRIQILAFANNQYAGHRPAAVKLFSDLWNQQS